MQEGLFHIFMGYISHIHHQKPIDNILKWWSDKYFCLSHLKLANKISSLTVEPVWKSTTFPTGSLLLLSIVSACFSSKDAVWSVWTSMDGWQMCVTKQWQAFIHPFFIGAYPALRAAGCWTRVVDQGPGPSYLRTQVGYKVTSSSKSPVCHRPTQRHK